MEDKEIVVVDFKCGKRNAKLVGFLIEETEAGLYVTSCYYTEADGSVFGERFIPQKDILQVIYPTV